MVCDMMTRQKILPEDMIQKTNLRQHNLMIDAINEVDERQSAVEDITDAVTADVATVKGNLIALSNAHRTDFIALSNAKLDKASINKDLHFGEIALTREGTSVIASMDVYNPVTGVVTPISFTIPGATPTEAGVMPADDAAWIAEAEGRISALEGMSDVKALVGLPEDPTQAEITSAWMDGGHRAPETGDLAQDVSNAKLWIFVVDRWVLHGVVVTVPVATATSLGGVKDTALGAPANRWYCHVEADGRVALIGGDSLSTLLDTTIPAMQVGLAQKADKTEVNDVLALKADKTELALKADKTELALKADKAEVNNALALKADKTELVFLLAPLFSPVNCTEILTMYKNNTSITSSPLINATNCTSLAGVFYGCTNLATVEHIICANATNMFEMFSNCSSLTTIPALDTAKVTYMGSMFRGCSSLTTIPALDTAKVTDMESMFRGCSSLTTIPLLNISSVTSMRYMFLECSSLTSVTFQCDYVSPYGPNMFHSTPIASGNGRIYVPDNLVQAYKTASGWSAHASVIYGHSDKP